MQEKSLCPVCNTNNIIEETFELDKKDLISYLCLRCGYTSNTEYKLGSDLLNHMLHGSTDHSQLVMDIHFMDENTGLYWFPIVLIKTDGSIFPEGTKDDWEWVYVPIIKVSEEEKKEYGEEYDKRFAIDKKELFDKYDFLSACKKLGVLTGDIQVD